MFTPKKCAAQNERLTVLLCFSSVSIIDDVGWNGNVSSSYRVVVTSADVWDFAE
jgi:hypothetical protein